MTLGHFLNHMGIGPKQLTDRFSQTDYGVAHDPHSLYAHQPAHNPHHVADSKHHHHHGGGGGHKNNAAMSALTLLAFLFFLHILQQCLKEHMTAMSTPQVVVMTGGREGEQNIAKTTTLHLKEDVEAKSPDNENKIEQPKSKNGAKGDPFTKIPTAEHTPFEKHKSKFVSQNSFPGFFSAMDD